MTKNHKTVLLRSIWMGVILLSCAGCQTGNIGPLNGAARDEVFKPPTQPAPLQTATPEEKALQLKQPTPPCQNGLAFLADITIPDGTVVEPGAVVEKTWEVENIGSCGWTSGYSLRHVGGSDMGAGSSLPLYPARAGTRARITIQFTAPSQSGTIHSAWRAYGPDDQPFGDAVYVQMNVSLNQQP